MNTLFRLSTLTLLGCLSGHAQSVREEPAPDYVLEAIREFKRADSGNPPNEVTVVLAPPVEDAAIPKAKPVEDQNPASPAVLVTGKPPEGTLIEDDPQEIPLEEPAAPAEPEGGLDVRVEKLRTREGPVDPGEVSLHAPFPAKPLSRPPAGWMIDVSADVPPLVREVEISPGTRISLTIRPHLLVPEADGHGVFAIPEPGFDPALGYQQAATVGAILSGSVRDLDEHSKDLGHAIDLLQQLLVSLPSPEQPSNQQ